MPTQTRALAPGLTGTTPPPTVLLALHVVEIGGLAALAWSLAAGAVGHQVGDGRALIVVLAALSACVWQGLLVFRGAPRLTPAGLALQAALLVVALASLLGNPVLGVAGSVVAGAVLAEWGRVARRRPDSGAISSTAVTEQRPDIGGRSGRAEPAGEWAVSALGRAALVVATVLVILVALVVRPGMLIGVLLLAGVFVPIERWFPLHRRRVLRSRWRTDLVHYLVNGSLILLGVFAVAAVVGTSLRALVPVGVRAAVGTSPQWAQILVAFIVATVGGYAGHREAHEVPLLWRFHRVHHSIRELDWLAASHLNPVDEIFIRSCAVVPLVALGFSRASLGAYVVLLTLQAVFVHANVRFSFGPLRWIVATPRFHHWHHARQPRAYNANYAGEFPGVDLLFGTWYLPAGRWPPHYGVADAEPDGYLRQVAWSFRVPCRSPAAGSVGD